MLYQGPLESSPCRNQIIPYLFPTSFLNHHSQEASGLLCTPWGEDVGWRWTQTKESVALMQMMFPGDGTMPNPVFPFNALGWSRIPSG